MRWCGEERDKGRPDNRRLTRLQKRESDHGATVDKHVKLQGARVRNVRYKPVYTCRTVANRFILQAFDACQCKRLRRCRFATSSLCFCPTSIYYILAVEEFSIMIRRSSIAEEPCFRRMSMTNPTNVALRGTEFR